ncbi:MAG: glycine/sarcosine/betaine reductase selenoprotein B family protein [Deltaproteobacteria bacterium]
MKFSTVIVGLGARLFTWNRPLLEFWARHAKVIAHADTPWTPLRREPGACTVALVTTAGVHLASDAPFDMDDRRGDPSFREIPSDAPAGRLVVTHDYYDHRDADRDVNVVFPVDRLRELAGSGEIGRAAPFHYSFMGHVTGPHVATLRDATSREVARRLRGAGVDLVLLSPA